jgi:ankyrin repeat protein
MAREKAQKKQQETTLLPHRTPNLSALLEHAKTGDSALAVEAYLDAGGSANVLVPRRILTGVDQIPLLLYMALFSNHPHTELGESVRLLLEAGAHINALGGPEGDKRTALMCAISRRCCTEVLQAYLLNGADVLVCSPTKGVTTLHYAATKGQTDSCKLLLASENSVVDVKAVDGSTALMQAVASEHVHIVKLLLQNGADVNAVSNDNTTALIAASVLGRVDLAATLIEAGADVNAVDSRGHRPVMAAVHSNSTTLVQLLLDHGADISARDNKGGNALFMAAYGGHVAMLDLLVKLGLSIKVDSSGTTLLMMAVSNEHTPAIEWLLQRGADVNAVNAANQTALHYASMNHSDNVTMIKLLLANDADVHKLNEQHETALYITASRGNIECAKALIAAGADVNCGGSNI